ncbi:chaperone protein dnaJ 11, chloroplastic-like [Tasmannia lanceolata]|uniref:chaperone protein dnaJ 11, chloroplastic-like n=1 Tax=Tasmannia lanceolata TaxID=3420 RepID=UPI00406413F6
MIITPSPFLHSPNLAGISLRSPGNRPCVRFRPAKAYATSSSYLYTSQPRMNSLYDILGLPIGATCQEIKAAYRKLARVCHPDVVAIDRKDTSADEFMKIHAAYSTLSDPNKRADYDRTVLRRFPSSGLTGSDGSRFSGYGRRTWETDQCW